MNNNNANNTPRILFSEHQIKKIERTVDLTKLANVFPIVFSFWAVSFYIAFVVIIKDIYLTSFVVPVLVCQGVMLVTSPVVFVCFYFFKKFLTRVRNEADGVRNNFQLLKLLLTFELVFIIGFIMLSLTILVLYPPVLNPQYSCEAFWEHNGQNWGFSDPDIYQTLCETEHLAQKLAIVVILTIAISCAFLSLPLIMIIKIIISWSFLHARTNIEFQLLQIKYFGLKMENQENKENQENHTPENTVDN
eukprot:TRINITY_DN1252_c0_g2_i7.p1 TRINITY_DN1252_c0_g2~~TRINITY_DN1252_c0_g2_i7.p1  ORF type:complete len:248 (-),score=13.16 TRINITY_DN1252_c0_g2_i7:597-1340(-)